MISANGVEYKNVPEQVQYLTEQVADIWTAIEGINPPDLTLYALKTYVDAADSALGTRITAVENSIGTLLTKTEAANTYAKIADIGTYINLSDYVKTTDMYTYVQAEIQNFDLDSNTDFTALKSRVSTLESSVSSMTSDIADANTTAANAQTAAGNAVTTANNASAVATNAYNTATSAASDVADMQTTLDNYDSRIDAVESTVDGFQASLTTAQNTANVALTKAESALSMIAGLHSLTKEEVEFEGDNVAITGFVEGSLCTLTKLEGKTEKSENLLILDDVAQVVEVGVTRKYENGGVFLNGTATGNKTLFIFNNREINTGDSFYGQFFVTGTITPSDSSQRFQLASQINHYYLNGTTSSIGLAKTGGTNASDWYFAVIIKEGDVFNNVIIRPMLIQGSTAPTEWSQGYTGLKSVSISGLSTGGGVVITTSEGTTSLVPTLDDDTLELRAYDYLDQTISGTNIITSLVRGSGIVDLGTLNWTYITDGDYPIFLSQTISDILGGTFGVTPNVIISGKYTLMASTGGANFKSANYNGYYTIRSNNRDIMIQDTSYTDAATFKTAMSGVYLVYERATPVTTVLATVTYTDVSAFFESGATITVNNANTQYDVESTSTMYGYVAE